MARDERGEAAPELTVLVDGGEAPPELSEAIQALRVEESLDAAGMFALTLANYDVDTHRVKWSDDDRFRLGAQVEVRMGYVGAQESLIVGEVTGLEPVFGGGRSLLTVRGYDRLHRFRRGRATRSYLEVKDSQVAEELAAELGLQAEVEDSGEIHPYLLRNNQTAVDFLLERARAIGFELSVAGSTLRFRPRSHAKGKVVTLEWGRELVSFHPVLSSVGQVTRVVVRGWDRSAREAVVGTAVAADAGAAMGGGRTGPQAAEEAFGEARVLVVDRPVATAREAERMARGILEERALGYVTGEGVTVGNPAIRAGTVVELAELGARFSGMYYVTATEHVRDERGFFTRFAVRRNAA